MQVCEFINAGRYSYAPKPDIRVICERCTCSQANEMVTSELYADAIGNSFFYFELDG
jgi:hypothetical protein